MILLPIATILPLINPYYTSFRKGELLGFMPCSVGEDGYSRYYSCPTSQVVRVAPIFYLDDMVFDSEPNDAKPGPALFFHGCDDGHMGMKFDSKEEALKWIEDCPYNDFEFMLEDQAKKHRAGQPTIKFHYHN